MSGTSKKLTQDTLSMAVTPPRSRWRSLPSGSQPYPRPSQWSAPRQLPANWSRFGCHLIAEYALGTAVPAPARAARLAAAGLALGRGPRSLALRDLRADRLRHRRRRARELQAGADGGEVVDIARNQSQSAEFEVWHFADLSSALAALHCSACF